MYALGFEQVRYMTTISSNAFTLIIKEGNDYLVLPEDVDLSLVKDVLLVESGVKASVASSIAPATQETAASVPSLRLGKSAKGGKIIFLISQNYHGHFRSELF